MRVVFLAVDDEFAGLMQQHVYEQRATCVVGSVISSTLVHGKSNMSAALFLARQSGPMYLAQMIKMKIVRKMLKNGEDVSASSLAVKHGVEQYHTSNINGPEALTKLRSWKPDLVISTNFSQYVGKQAREVASVGSWNLHKSYLPHYRGMAPSFYALLEDTASVGATLHVLAKGFDTGDILCQIKIPIEKGDTVYELNKRTSAEGGRMLVDFLERFDPRHVKPMPQSHGDWRTYSYPTRADLRAFRRKGCRF